MADKSDKVEGNVPGKYYVTSECNGCSVCEQTAPENFKMSDDEEHAIVYKQPANDEERANCEEALDSCPEEAIGDDGE